MVATTIPAASLPSAAVGASTGDLMSVSPDGKLQLFDMTALPLSTPQSTQMSTAVSQAVSTSTQNLTAQIAALKAQVNFPITLSNGRTYNDLASMVIALNAGGGGTSPSAPTIGTPATPAISDSTVDVGQTNLTVTPISLSGGTGVSVAYRWVVAGVPQSASNAIWTPIGGIAQTVAAAGGVALTTTQTLVLQELISYSGSAQPIIVNSTTYTLNAGAAVPVNTAKPSFSGTAAPGQTLSLLSGSWSNTPTTWDYLVYDGDPLAGGVLVSSQLAQAATGVTLALTTGVYNGKTLFLNVIAHNAAGASVAVAAAAAVVVSGGIAPVATLAPIGFGYMASYPVATAIPLEYMGAEFWANTPSATGYLVTIYRDGVSIGTFANLTSYLPVLADQDKTISYSVTASNAGGISAAARSTGLLIVAQVGGGGGGGGSLTTSFVGAISNGTNTAASLSIAVGSVSPAVNVNDAALHIRSSNGTTWTGTPSGFTTILDTAFHLTANGKYVDAYVKTLTGSEPSTYVNTPSASEILGAILAVWRRSDGTAASWLAHAQQLQNTAQTSPFVATFPTVNAGGSAAAGQRCVLVLVLDPNSGETATFSNLPAGYSLVAQQNFVGGTDWQPIAIFEGPAPSSGATGAQTLTVTTSAGTAGWGTYSFIVG